MKTAWMITQDQFIHYNFVNESVNNSFSCYQMRGTFTRQILSADNVTAVNGKKPLRSVLVELEIVPIFFVSDTDIEATTNQRWTAEGPLANPHMFRVVIASQWCRSRCSS